MCDFVPTGLSHSEKSEQRSPRTFEYSKQEFVFRCKSYNDMHLCESNFPFRGLMCVCDWMSVSVRGVCNALNCMECLCRDNRKPSLSPRKPLWQTRVRGKKKTTTRLCFLRRLSIQRQHFQRPVITQEGDTCVQKVGGFNASHVPMSLEQVGVTVGNDPQQILL